MKTNRICWPSSRGLINSCTTYLTKNGSVKIIREPIEQGVILKRINQDNNGIIKKVITYISKNGKQQKFVQTA